MKPNSNNFQWFILFGVFAVQAVIGLLLALANWVKGP